MTPFEIAEMLVSCLEISFQDDPGRPQDICQRPGDQVPFGLSITKDECCSGLAWVRVQEIAPATDPASLTDPDFSPCTDTGSVVTLELGVVRCNPYGAGGALPTCEDWTALAARMDLDWRAMRRAVCCAGEELLTDSSPVLRVLPGPWTPLDSAGGCAGGSMTVIVELDCTDC